MKYLLACIFILLTACSTSPPQLKAQLTAVNFLNPNINNRPSPVVVTVLQLKSPTIFQQTNFFALYNNPIGILGSDLLDKREIEVQPNQRLELQQNLAQETNFIGVIAAFRNPDRAQWRQLITVNTGHDAKLQIHLTMQDVYVATR